MGKVVGTWIKFWSYIRALSNINFSTTVEIVSFVNKSLFSEILVNNVVTQLKAK